MLARAAVGAGGLARLAARSPRNWPTSTISD